MIDLVEDLKELVDSGETYPYLKFGVKYALKIQSSNLTPNEILKRANLSITY